MYYYIMSTLNSQGKYMLMTGLESQLPKTLMSHLWCSKGRKESQEFRSQICTTLYPSV